MSKYRKARKPLPVLNPGKPAPLPVDEADPDAVADALEQCDRVRNKIEEAPDRVLDAAGDFFASVDEGVAGVAETIEKRRRVTPKQQAALDNWEGGVDRWLKNARED